MRCETFAAPFRQLCIEMTPVCDLTALNQLVKKGDTHTHTLAFKLRVAKLPTGKKKSPELVPLFSTVQSYIK